MKSFIYEIKEYLPELLSDLKGEIQKEAFPFVEKRNSLEKEVLEGNLAIANWIETVWLSMHGEIKDFLKENSIEKAAQKFSPISLYLFVILTRTECPFLEDLKKRAKKQKEVRFGKKKLEELLSHYKEQMKKLKKDDDDIRR